MKSTKLKIKVSFKEAYNAAYNMNLGLVHIMPSDIISNGELPVVYKDSVVWGSSSLIACCGTCGFQKVIFVDSFFFMLPEFVKEFIIAHEQGHTFRGHNEQIKNATLYNGLKRRFKLSPLEVEADLFAAKTISKEKTVESIKYLINDTTLPLATKSELKKRLKAISELSQEEINNLI